MDTKKISEMALEQGKGILRLAPTWVPRVFCIPGRRIKLHPADYYALGGERGGLDERWFSSTTPADNGPKTAANEGLSFIVFQDGSKTQKVLLKEAVAQLKGDLIGQRLWKEYKRWPMYSKFFDNKGPLPHHLHQRLEHAKLVDQRGKYEAYYFPRQVNNYGGDFPYTFFGLIPGTTREQVRECMANFTKGDNKITNLSQAYRLEVGTGWDVPPGILHAPGSLCTYEPQEDSDVFGMYQSMTGDQIISEELLWKNVPPQKRGNLDYVIEMIDWEKNVDSNFFGHHFMRPKPVKPEKEMEKEGYIEKWICYKTKHFSAKELTVLPKRSVTIYDSAAYGLIMLQGYGQMNNREIETPTVIYYGQLTNDEYFVSETTACQGVKITNPSSTDPIVMLKHFGPGNPDLKVEK